MILVTCAIILNNLNQVLAVQRSLKMNLPLKWEFPGGKVETGETFEECLIREIKEELGVTIVIQSSFGEYKYSYLTQSITLYPFICSIVSGKMALTEHKAFRWLNPEQLLQLDWAEADIAIVKDYLLLNHKF